MRKPGAYTPPVEWERGIGFILVGLIVLPWALLVLAGFGLWVLASGVRDYGRHLTRRFLRS